MSRLLVRVTKPGKDPTVGMWCSYPGERCEVVEFLCDNKGFRKAGRLGKTVFYGDGTRYLIVLNPDKRDMGPLCWVPIQQLDTHGVLLIRDEVEV